jgi:hypothetical protein
MVPREAILKAIEGGLFDGLEPVANASDLQTREDGEVRLYRTSGLITRGHVSLGNTRDFVLAPAFWRALCSGLGCRGSWKQLARRFFDCVLEERDTTSFWREVLNSGARTQDGA